MKRIIDGVTYNTDTSTVIARAELADDDWATKGGDRMVQTLYQTRGGAFFIHIDTTTVRRSLRDNGWEEVERHEFEAMTRDQAHRWVMEGQVELLHDVFGEPPEATEEAAPGATLYIRIPTSLKDRLELLAKQEGLSLNAWTMRCVERCANVAAPNALQATSRNALMPDAVAPAPANPLSGLGTMERAFRNPLLPND